MSEREKQINEMTPFERDLAALVPRVDGFDRERLIFLAGQASAMRSLQDRRSRFARWGWPAAFSAMTAVAAALLVALCLRGPATTQVAGGTNKPEVQHVAAGPTRVASESADRETSAVADAAPSWLGSWLAIAPPGNLESGIDDAALAEADPALWAEMRRHGIGFRRTGEPVSCAPVVVAESPLTYYELLNRLQGRRPTRAILAATDCEFPVATVVKSDGKPSHPEGKPSMKTHISTLFVVSAALLPLPLSRKAPPSRPWP